MFILLIVFWSYWSIIWIQYKIWLCGKEIGGKQWNVSLFNCTFYFKSLHLDGISSDFAGRLFIADTNNNVIRYLDLNREEAQLLTLELKGVQPPNPKTRSPKRLRRRSPETQTIIVDGGSFCEGNLSLKISLPQEYHFSKVHFHPCTLHSLKNMNLWTLITLPMHCHSYLIT